MERLTSLICTAFLMLAFNVCAAQSATGSAVDKPQDNSQHPNLEAFPSPDFDQVYIASEIKLATSRKIFIEDVEASFAPIWLERFRGLTSASYRENITQKYGEAFVAELAQSLEEAGWQVVNEPSEEVIRVRPKLFDLYIIAPETSGIEERIIAQSGQSGCELVFSAPDGEPFLKIVDWRNTRTTAGSPIVANRANNYRYFRMLMSDWADTATTYLNNIMAIVDEGQPSSAKR